MPAFLIREATQTDFVGMAKVRVDTWKAAYQGIVPDEFLENLSYPEISDRWKSTYWENSHPGVAVFVAENDRNEIVGFAICGPEQSQDPIYYGEIYALYVLPGCQNQGIGRGLFTACVQHLRRTLESDTLLVWVIAENPYRRFYESSGGIVVRGKIKEIGGKAIFEVGYGWELKKGK
jgi:GNAT superfamily N-acetyltransferase